MIKEIIYNQSDLESGKCICCGEESTEILKGDGRCIDCIQAEEFYQDTMINIDKYN